MAREDDPHAVRWARRALKHMRTLDYTRWHRAENCYFTLCGLGIQVGCEGTFLPEIDDRKSQVTCKHCLAILRRRDAATE